MTPQERKKREERIKRICDTINKAEKKDDTITYLGSGDVIPMARFPSGCSELDVALGGGWPIGRFIELFGPESGGKSTTCLHAIAEFQKAFPDKDVALIDTEYCLAKGTLVYDAEAMVYFPVEELLGRKDFFVISWVGGKMVPQKAKVSLSSKRDVYLVRCSGGRSIRLTGNHRVLTQDGYKTTEKLQAGDKMYAPASIPSAKSTFLADSKNGLYRILGYHIGDGTIGKDEIATVDASVVSDLEDIASKHDCSVTFEGTLARFRKKDLKFYDISKESLIAMFEDGMLIEEAALLCGCSVPTLSRRIKEYEIDKSYNFMKRAALARKIRDTNVKKSKSKYHGGLKSNIYDFLAQFPCFFEYSGARRIPEGLNNYQLSHVLAGMFMADGCVVNPDKQHRCSVYYGTTSRILALDVQVSLQRMGIFSSISEYVKPREDGGYYDKSYTVWIRGHHDVKRFNECIHLCGYKFDNLVSAIESVNSKKSDSIATKRGTGLVELDVLSVELDGTDETYDISVANRKDDEQNFLAEGMIVHNSFDEEYARAIGVDIEFLLVHQPESGEQALKVVRHLIHLGVGLIVVDSVAALTPEAELAGEIGDVHVGQQARLMSQSMRMLTAEAGSRSVTIFWTNQMREKIGVMYGEKTTTPGGRALRHYASIRVNISAISKEKDGEIIVGSKVQADVKKNKTAAPFKKAVFYISFGTGIDRIAAVCDAAIARKVVTKRGSKIVLGTDIIAAGRRDFLDVVKKDPELFKKLDELVKAAPPPETEEVGEAEEDEAVAKSTIKKPKSIGTPKRVPVTSEEALLPGDDAVETQDA